MNLENKFFYRLVKVLYICLITLAGFLSIFIGFISNNNGILWGILWAAILYSAINLFKDGIIYIAFGQKPSWKWFFALPNLFIKIKNKTEPPRSLETDPATLAALVVKMFFDKEQPFINWKPHQISIPEKLEATAQCSAIGYIFYVYLLLIRNKYGAEVSSTVKHHLLILFSRMEDMGGYLIESLSIIEFISKNHETPEVNLLVEENTEEYKTAAFFLITLPNNPYYLPEEKRRHITYNEIENHCGDDATFVVMQCLSYVRKQSITTFKPIIGMINLKPESISGLRIYEEIAWSKTPGCFERQLQRKMNNTLFHPKERKITQENVDDARKRDIEDTNILSDKTQIAIKTFQQFEESKSATFNQVFALMREVDELITRAYAIGGAALGINESLQSLRKNIASTINESLTSRGDLEGLKKFNECESNYYNNVTTFHVVFIQQTIRDDSPIKAELIPSILSEDIETIRLFLKFLPNKESLIEFKTETRKAVNAMLARSENISEVEKKLSQVEINL